MYERAVELLEAEVGDDLLALDAQAGQCYGFNSVAASVWRLLERPRTANELRESLLSEYDVSREQCDEELAELLDMMTAAGLIRRR